MRISFTNCAYPETLNLQSKCWETFPTKPFDNQFTVTWESVQWNFIPRHVFAANDYEVQTHAVWWDYALFKPNCRCKLHILKHISAISYTKVLNLQVCHSISQQKKCNYAQIMRTLFDYARIMKNANYAQNYAIA